MRRDGLTIRSMTSMVAVLLSAGLVGCNRGPQEVTSIQFDGQDRSITTQDVVCSKQPDGGLLIAVAGGSHQTVRVQLTE